MNPKKKALGRGLSAILESPETDITSTDISGNYVAGAIANIPVSAIEANPFQPRTDFEVEALEELAQSIREQGIIQPITVRKMGFDTYQLISGERRLRASHIAGLQNIPAYIRVANDKQMLEMALVENIQRENLNPMEIAISYKRLIEECEITQEELGNQVGKNRSTITNFLRLLKLPPEIQIALRDNKISMGHARALINVDDVEKQLTILKNILEKDLPVRKVEEWVRKLNDIESQAKKDKNIVLPDELSKVKEVLKFRFQVKVNLTVTDKGKGKIVIPFSSAKELDRIISLMNS
ncbi:MAG: ParB/RepB/Spo0J family partition protein [Lentimicrobiaceae bacterium]|nr:ParB/RepB/Spo0J family partition protein [Lentimicrobiaceae bacterium]